MTMYPLVYPTTIHAMYQDAVAHLQKLLCEAPDVTESNVMIIEIDCLNGDGHRIKVDRRFVRRYIIRVNTTAHRMVEEHFRRVSKQEKQHYHDGLLDISRQYFPVLTELVQQEQLNRYREGRNLRKQHEREKNHAVRLLLDSNEVPAELLFEFTSCYRKHRYETRAAAEAGILENHYNHRDEYIAYACDHCDHYPVGHPANPNAPYLYKLNRAGMLWGTHRLLANQFVLERGLYAHPLVATGM